MKRPASLLLNGLLYAALLPGISAPVGASSPSAQPARLDGATYQTYLPLLARASAASLPHWEAVFIPLPRRGNRFLCIAGKQCGGLASPIADVIVFLASGQAGGLTGRVVQGSGGHTCYRAGKAAYLSTAENVIISGPSIAST